MYWIECGIQIINKQSQLKVAWPDQISTCHHENCDFGIRRNVIIFSDYRSEAPSMFHLDGMNKIVVNFHKSVVTTPNVHTVFSGTIFFLHIF